MNEHLLQCARKQHTREAREHMKRQFDHIHRCAWNDCNASFRGKTCSTNSLHVTRHLQEIRTHECLWDSCLQVFDSYEKLAYHVSDQHRVPNEWTLLTKMHYCFEHDGWCQSDQQWVQHLEILSSSGNEQLLRINSTRLRSCSGRALPPVPGR
jgi:hypothetical protein